MEYNTLGHQTLEDRDNADEIEQDGPFRCDRPNAFLSPGYYFWDNDIKRAHDWGKINYSSGYVILECSLALQNMMDLVGNSIDFQEYELLLSALSKFYKNIYKEPLSRVIALLRRENDTRIKGIFEYDSIRVQDHPNPRWVYFVPGRPERMDRNPRIQICLFKKSPVSLRNVKIIYPEHYVQ